MSYEPTPRFLPCDKLHFEKYYAYLSKTDRPKEEFNVVNSINMKKFHKTPTKPVLYQSHHDYVPSFLVTLIFWERVLHNCGVESNIMPMEIMKKLGLRVNEPCHEIYGINSSWTT